MIYILIAVLVALMAMVVISLFRGLNAFRQGLDDADGTDPGTGATDLQILQNKMMWSRIKYQMAAVLAVVVLLSMAR